MASIGRRAPVGSLFDVDRPPPHCAIDAGCGDDPASVTDARPHRPDTSVPDGALDPSIPRPTPSRVPRSLPRALLVEALVRSGDAAGARARAATLEQRAPQSPQSARVRALLRDAP